MEQALIDKFYAGYLADLRRWIHDIDTWLNFYEEQRIRTMNTDKNTSLLSRDIVTSLTAERKRYEDDIKRIASRNQTAPRVVRWH